MFVKTPAMFYFLRFLLGVFEAGFYPGIILYLTYWFPQRAPRQGLRHVHVGLGAGRRDRRAAGRQHHDRR